MNIFSFTYFKTFQSNYLVNLKNFKVNCAISRGGEGGWWFRNCHHSNLNGEYQDPSKNDQKGLIWSDFNSAHSLKSSVMMVKRRN